MLKAVVEWKPSRIEELSADSPPKCMLKLFARASSKFSGVVLVFKTQSPKLLEERERTWEYRAGRLRRTWNLWDVLLLAIGKWIFRLQLSC